MVFRNEENAHPDGFEMQESALALTQAHAECLRRKLEPRLLIMAQELPAAKVRIGSTGMEGGERLLYQPFELGTTLRLRHLRLGGQGSAIIRLGLCFAVELGI